MPINSEDRLKGCVDRIFIKVLLENGLFRRGITLCGKVWMVFNLMVDEAAMFNFVNHLCQ